MQELSSPGRDTRISIRKDGLETFITSDRAGGLDIWTSTRETLDDLWSTPVALPYPVNTPAADGSPWLSRDGTTLYFFSTRTAGGFGGRDIWLSGTQTEPRLTRRTRSTLDFGGCLLSDRAAREWWPGNRCCQRSISRSRRRHAWGPARRRSSRLRWLGGSPMSRGPRRFDWRRLESAQEVCLREVRSRSSASQRQPRNQ